MKTELDEWVEFSLTWVGAEMEADRRKDEAAWLAFKAKLLGE
jgi:hypothetical protein